MGNKVVLDPEVSGITSKELYNFHSVFRSYFLVIDCRSEEEYLLSHVDMSIHHSNKLQNPCCNSYLKEVSKFDAIIMYGYLDNTQNSVLHRTCNNILQVKKHNSLSSLKVLKLNDGYDIYHSLYPFHCSDYPGYQHGMLFPSHIEDRVYLCGGGIATNIDVVRALKITHIVNCTVDYPFVDEIPTDAATRKIELTGHFERLRIPVVDDRDSRIQDYFPAAVAFIDTALLLSPWNVVLVHCKHGQSRSATILAAWLMATTVLPTSMACNHGMDSVEIRTGGQSIPPPPPPPSPVQAVAYLRSCRSVVRPNDGFLEQLEAWARSRSEDSNGQ